MMKPMSNFISLSEQGLSLMIMAMPDKPWLMRDNSKDLAEDALWLAGSLRVEGRNAGADGVLGSLQVPVACEEVLHVGQNWVCFQATLCGKTLQQLARDQLSERPACP